MEDTESRRGDDLQLNRSKKYFFQRRNKPRSLGYTAARSAQLLAIIFPCVQREFRVIFSPNCRSSARSDQTRPDVPQPQSTLRTSLHLRQLSHCASSATKPEQKGDDINSRCLFARKRPKFQKHTNLPRERNKQLGLTLHIIFFLSLRRARAAPPILSSEPTFYTLFG